MSCACENRRLGQEFERIRRLAKAWARMEERTTVIYQNEDGTFGFTSNTEEITKPIVEYITPF